MVTLSLERINTNSPYQVSASDLENRFTFQTGYGVIYSVQFLDDDLLSYESYEFVIVNANNRKSPSDKKLKDTVIAILREFFTVNNSTILYICETGDKKQSMRARLFDYWFSSAHISEQITHLSTTIIDTEGVQNYAAIFLRNDNPNFKNIVAEFTDTIETFSNKPLN
jgi:hypothetical protein